MLATRLALGDGRTAAQAIAELALFLAVTAAVTWAAERTLLREVVGQARSGGGLRSAVAAG